MDKTSNSLRRVRGYIVLLVVCAIYAVLPESPREIAKDNARQLAGAAIAWVVAHTGRVEK